MKHTPTDAPPRAERRRRRRSLGTLAITRASFHNSRTAREWLDTFIVHFGTPDACPTGHPECTDALVSVMQENVDKNYVCPACWSKPFHNLEVS